MDLTEFKELLHSEMAWAMERKRERPGEDAFLMRVRIVAPGDQVVDTPLSWGSHQEKRLAMRVLSKVCEQMFAQAAVIVSDTRYLNVSAFCSHFGIPAPQQPGDFASFERERLRIMEPYEFDMGKLPRSTWEEALMVAIKGPKVNLMATTRYVAAAGMMSFEPMISAGDLDGKVEINMLPTWWN